MRSKLRSSDFDSNNPRRNWRRAGIYWRKLQWFLIAKNCLGELLALKVWIGSAFASFSVIRDIEPIPLFCEGDAYERDQGVLVTSIKIKVLFLELSSRLCEGCLGNALILVFKFLYTN